jgi:CHAT domain-containing protein
MSEFYRLWRHEGIEPPVALNRAQHWLRSATRADLTDRFPGAEAPYTMGEHPYVEARYWAAFAYTGA